MGDVDFRRLVSTDRTPLNLRKLVRDDSSKLVDIGCSLHEPVPVDTEGVEAMKAGINSHQVNSVGELLGFKLSLTVTEGFETYRTPAPECIIVLTKAVPQVLIQVVEQSINLVSFFVAMPFQALHDVAF